MLKTLQGLAFELHVLRRHVSSEYAREKMLYIEGVCRRSGQEMKDIIHELRNEEGEGIASQISVKLQKWSDTTGIKSAFSLSGNDRVLSSLANYNLRFVLAEALTNIEKHSSASRVQVCVNILSDELSIEIHDNGCGIGPAAEDPYNYASKDRFGVLGMKERVEQLNGQFTIHDIEGTKIIVRIPLEEMY